MAQHTLYTYPLAYAPMKAALALAEKGIPYTSRYVELFAAPTPEFLRLNAKGTVPVLQRSAAGEADRIIADSRLIVEYVNGLEPGPLGGSDADQALAAVWVEKLHAWDGNLFIAVEGDPAAAKVLGGLQEFKIRSCEARAKQHPELAAAYQDKIAGIRAADAQAHDAAAADANRAQLEKLLDEAEQQLGRSAHLAGEAYSIADVVFTPLLFRLGMANKTGHYLKPRPAVSAYFDRMKQRPSFAKAFGPASSKLTLATTIVPALVKAKLAALTGWY